VSMNFREVGLGDSWISPIDFVDTWPDYLFYFNRFSTGDLAKAKNQAAECDRLVEKESWTEATDCWNEMEDVVLELSGGVNWYNVLKQSDQASSPLSSSTGMKKYRSMYSMLLGPDDELDDLMNGPVRKKLGVIPSNVTWGGQSAEVFSQQSGDFMKPVIDTVDALLNSTNLTVIIYNGQLDLICDTAGVERWVDKLRWQFLKKFRQSTRSPFIDKFGDKNIAGFVQQYKPLYFFWILKAGHMAPADNPTAVLTLLDMITSL